VPLGAQKTYDEDSSLNHQKAVGLSELGARILGDITAHKEQLLGTEHSPLKQP
jgi:hypothetical protein